MKYKTNRRHALKTIVASSVMTSLSAQGRAADSPNEKLNLAFIGVGGRGEANLKELHSQNIVAFVDVDEERGGKSFESYPSVQRFKDYRKMLDEVGSRLDGVVISTPDHTHFHPAYAAMQMGLHVYLEKPLAHNVWETRMLTNYAAKHRLATQLGCQRHAIPNMAHVVELIAAGAIGKVSQVYCWKSGNRGMPEMPTDRPPIPKTVDYDLWVGPVKNARPYHPSICPYGWRFWWQFGSGETGNWGCHILDIPYWALGLGHADRVQASGPPVDAERSPKAMHCEFHFPTSNQGGPIKMHWDHGDPGTQLEDVTGISGLNLKGMNTCFIGEKGSLLAGFDKHQLLPEDQFKEYTVPAHTIPKSPGFHQEWVHACKGNAPATCNFDYSGPLSETVLLGNVAYRTGDFMWNHQELSTGENTKAQALIREEYRTGWDI